MLGPVSLSLVGTIDRGMAPVALEWAPLDEPRVLPEKDLPEREKWYV